MLSDMEDDNVPVLVVVLVGAVRSRLGVLVPLKSSDNENVCDAEPRVGEALRVRE